MCHFPNMGGEDVHVLWAVHSSPLRSCDQPDAKLQPLYQLSYGAVRDGEPVGEHGSGRPNALWWTVRRFGTRHPSG